MWFFAFIPTALTQVFRETSYDIKELPQNYSYNDSHWNVEHRLLRQLFANYSAAVRGVAQPSDVVVVKIGVTLTHISKIEEKNQVLQLSLYLEQEWSDVRLTWNLSDFPGLKDINVAHGRVWMPDIVLFNNAENYKDFKPTNVAIYNNGSVVWAPPMQLRLTSNMAERPRPPPSFWDTEQTTTAATHKISQGNAAAEEIEELFRGLEERYLGRERNKSVCRLDLRMFPFDYQICRLKFGSWMHDMTSVDVDRRNDTISLDGYIDNGEWQIMDLTIHREQQTNCLRALMPQESKRCIVYPRIVVTVYLRRRVLFYVYNVIIPCSMLSMLTLVQFWLPSESGEKVTLGLTVLLAYSVFSFNIGESMPEISETIPLVAIYIMTIMGTSALSVTLSVVVLNLHHAGARSRRVPRWLAFLAFRILAPITRQHVPERFSRRVQPKKGLESSFCAGCLPFRDAAKKEIPVAYFGSNRQSAVSNVRGYHATARLASVLLPTNQRFHLSEALGRAGILLDKCELEGESHSTAAEWRAVARTLDIFLFWVVFSVTVLVTFGMLVVAPYFNSVSYPMP